MGTQPTDWDSRAPGEEGRADTGSNTGSKDEEKLRKRAADPATAGRLSDGRAGLRAFGAFGTEGTQPTETNEGKAKKQGRMEVRDGHAGVKRRKVRDEMEEEGELRRDPG